MVGKGRYGECFLVKSKEIEKNFVIKKVIRKCEVLSEELMNELIFCLYLDHPNVVQLYEYFFETIENVNYLYLVMEYCEGGKIYNKYLFKSKS